MKTRTLSIVIAFSMTLLVAANRTRAEIRVSYDSLIVTGTDLASLLESYRTIGVGRFTVEVQKDVAGNELVRRYRDVATIDGYAKKSQSGAYTALVVKLGPTHTLQRTAVNSFYIWYVDPRTRQWVQYYSTTDANVAGQVLQYVRNAGLTATYTTGVSGYQWVEVNAAAPTTNLTATSTTLPGDGPIAISPGPGPVSGVR